VSARNARLAGNEALFQEVNERVAEVTTHFIEVGVHTEIVEFTCECGRHVCAEPISKTLVEYEAIRAEPTHFEVLPDHELPEIETVIPRFPTYFVVEKGSKDAREVARDTDPRTYEMRRNERPRAACLQASSWRSDRGCRCG
jgi:hypothetical protein